MCIRDRHLLEQCGDGNIEDGYAILFDVVDANEQDKILYDCCLLYTSDAADERSSVDLGGRRIIKNKKNDI